MNLMIQPNQICLIVKLYNNRPKLLPDSNVFAYRTKKRGPAKVLKDESDKHYERYNSVVFGPEFSF